MKRMRFKNVKNKGFLTAIVQLCFPVCPEGPFFPGKLVQPNIKPRKKLTMFHYNAKFLSQSVRTGIFTARMSHQF